MLKVFSMVILGALKIFINDSAVSDQRISYRKCHEFNFTDREQLRAVRSINQENSEDNVGMVETFAGEFPSMAALGYKNDDGAYKYVCGGVLISPDFVLTSAVCTHNHYFGSPSVVRIGVVRIDDSDLKANIAISRIHVHPQYRVGRYYNDIALLQLEWPSTYPPACLWQTNEINFSEGTVTGYGANSFHGLGNTNLLKNDLSFYSNKECKSFYKDARKLENGIVDAQLCMGDPNRKKDTCRGDTGSPIFVKINEGEKQIPYVAGIISFGRFALYLHCSVGTPFVSTRVSSYLDWIESIVWR